MEKITLKQRLIASEWFFYSLILCLSVATTAATLIQLELTPQLLDEWSAMALVVVVAVLAFVVSWFVSGIIVGLILLPFCHDQALKNGAPFAVGDCVKIIAGSNRGVVSKVYAKAQHESNRVDLGKDARENFSDIFADYQLLRCDGNRQVTFRPGAVKSATQAGTSRFFSRCAPSE